MSTASTQSRGVNKRFNSLQNGHPTRSDSYSNTRVISHNDAYLYALRVAYLAYLLQPRARRTQHVPAPQAPVQRSSTSINDLMKDFSLVRDSKSTKFPHGFMAELEKRLTGVLMGKEKRAEYNNDAAIKRTFAAFFNAFSEPSFKKRMEKDRRVEDLVLIFFSNATKELSKGKQQGDDAWKLMVDRHLALFVRLVSLVLKDHDWVRDRPDLTSRLATLESKLLAHDQDLAAAPTRNGAGGGTTIEVEVPLSYDVKDMPLVQTVARIFGLRNTMVQSDLNKYKSVWTEKAALQDLKTYQTLLNLNSRKTLRSDDFDLDEAYDQWKKGEIHDLSQMMLAIMQSNPELTKSTTGSLPQFGHRANSSDASDLQYPDRRTSDYSEASSYVIDQPVDMANLSSRSQSPESSADDDKTFTFMPSDTRGYYRFIVAQALTHDMNDKDLQAPVTEASSEPPPIKLLSKQCTELLNEICLRWRIPYVSRIMLFLDVIHEKFVDQEISLDALDAAFNFIKEQPPENRKHSNIMSSVLLERSKWLLTDTVLNQQILNALHVALLRDLYDVLQHCYEPKPPSVGPIVYVLENHIYDDPGFSKTQEDLDVYRDQLYEGLQGKAHEMYRAFLQKEVPNDQNSWEFFHVIELGKMVVALAQRIQKRYRKNPEVMGYVASLPPL